MTDIASGPGMTEAARERAVSYVMTEAGQRRVRRRYAAETRFRAYGIAAVGIAVAALVLLLSSIFVQGIPAFWSHSINLTVQPTAENLGLDTDAIMAPAGEGGANASLAQIQQQLLSNRERLSIIESEIDPDRAAEISLISEETSESLREIGNELRRAIGSASSGLGHIAEEEEDEPLGDLAAETRQDLLGGVSAFLAESRQITNALNAYAPIDFDSAMAEYEAARTETVTALERFAEEAPSLEFFEDYEEEVASINESRAAVRGIDLAPVQAILNRTEEQISDPELASVYTLAGEKVALEEARRAINAANYAGPVNEAMRAVIGDEIDPAYVDRVLGLVSGGAAFDLRGRILDDPTLIGEEINLDAIVSDEAELYLKGQATDIEQITINGEVGVVREGDTVRLLSSSNDFRPIVDSIRENIDAQIASTQGDIARAESVLSSAQARLEAGNTGVEDDVTLAQAELNTLTNRLEALQTKFETVGDTLPLTPEVPSYLININGGVVKATAASATEIGGEEIIPLQSDDNARPGDWFITYLELPEALRKVNDVEIVWLSKLREENRIESGFNTRFFQTGDSREPELAGILGAVIGSFYTMVVTLLLAFPIGVAAAIYLEEFAPKTWWTDIIEVNINNLAAVPSIVFGLLGLAVFLNIFGFERSAPYVGGTVLALMTLPTIIIASRAALKAVPPSIRHGAMGVGASKMQAVFHHALPLAMPGILTGTIIGLAQALGETAPLLMIGMVAFIVDLPTSIASPATVLPVQVYIWADSPERGFVEKTAAAIMVLLGFLILMNILAVILRKRFERRW